MDKIKYTNVYFTNEKSERVLEKRFKKDTRNPYFQDQNIKKSDL